MSFEKKFKFRSCVSNMFLVKQNYFVYLIISLYASQRNLRLCQTPDAQNFAKEFTELILSNILTKSSLS